MKLDFSNITGLFEKNPDEDFGAKRRGTATFIKIVLLFAAFEAIHPLVMKGKIALSFSLFALLAAVLSAVDLVIKRNGYIEEKLPHIIGMITALGFSAVLFLRRDTIVDKHNNGGMFKIFAVFFVISAVLIIIAELMEDLIRKRRCTVPVTASCVGTVLYSRGRNKSYVHVWEFFFEGKTVRASDRMPQMYYMMEKISNGQPAEIMVNPDDPQDIYRRSPGRLTKKICICLFIAAAAVYAMNSFFIR